ncbi:MAG: hypothetical protein PF961_23255 [Planctomycetota bacterium]|nr:hypothetical protein [Planctomycetota bacterium]
MATGILLAQQEIIPKPQTLPWWWDAVASGPMLEEASGLTWSNWRISSPFGPSDKAFVTVFPPEIANAQAELGPDGKPVWTWKPLKSPPINGHKVDFRRLAKNIERRAVYLDADLTVDADSLLIGRIWSDDGLRIFIDGQEVLADPGFGDKRLSVPVSAGVHRVLFKVSNGTGGWALQTRFVDGASLGGIKSWEQDPTTQAAPSAAERKRVIAAYRASDVESWELYHLAALSPDQRDENANKRLLDLIGRRAESLSRARKHTELEGFTARVVAAAESLGLSDGSVNALQNRRAEALRQLERHSEALSVAEMQLAVVTAGEAWRRWQLLHARCALALNDTAQALSDVRAIILASPEPNDETFAAAVMQAELLADTPEAVASAYAVYAIARDAKQMERAVRLVCANLKTADGSLERVGLFLDYQRFGPAGRGEAGSSSPMSDPIGVTGRQVQDAAWRSALEGEIQAPVADLAAMRKRGYLKMHLGDTEGALKDFATAFRLAPFNERSLRDAAQRCALALKAHHGAPQVIATFLDYQRFGPKGPDGEAGTADDLTDPLQTQP